MQNAVIIVDKLSLHSEPGGDETIVGETKRNEVFDVIKREVHPKAEWIRGRRVDGRVVWFALRNRQTGVAYARVESDPPYIERREPTWLPLVVAIFAVFGMAILIWIMG